MSKFIQNWLKGAPIILGVVLVNSQINSQNAIAAPAPSTPLQSSSSQNLLAQAIPRSPTSTGLDIYDNKSPDEGIFQNPMSQVTSVSELRDVQPTEWAFEALRSLVERYGCIVGYPDRTFRGNKALSRWEFAAGLNACLNTIERLIQENVAVLKADIETLRRLAEKFKVELAALGTRVDNLEGRVAFLEDHQFSTTTTFRGEFVYTIADTFGNKAGEGTRPSSNRDETQTVAQYRTRLFFDNTFTGQDLLRTRLQAANFAGNQFNAFSPTGTNQTRISYDVGGDSLVTLNQLFYRNTIGPVTYVVSAAGVFLDGTFNTVNPLLGFGPTGSVARIPVQNSLVYNAPGGAGAGLSIQNDFVNFAVAYLTSNPANPNQGAGLFNGEYAAGAQLTFTFDNGFQIAGTYAHTYQRSQLFAGVTSLKTELPFGINNPTSADRFGIQANYRVNPVLNLNAWGGYANAKDETGTFANQDIWTWNASVALVDIGKEGSLLWLSGGLPPRATNEIGTSYIVETGYRYPINDNIAITPAFYFVFNPNNNNNNSAIYVGALRTLFLF